MQFGRVLDDLESIANRHKVQSHPIKHIFISTTKCTTKKLHYWKKRKSSLPCRDFYFITSIVAIFTAGNGAEPVSPRAQAKTYALGWNAIS
jgi:hypothetical protein